MLTIFTLCLIGALIAFTVFTAFVLMVKYLLPKENEEN